MWCPPPDLKTYPKMAQLTFSLFSRLQTKSGSEQLCRDDVTGWEVSRGVNGDRVDMLSLVDVTRWSMNFGDYEDGYDDFSADGFNYSSSVFNFSLREAIRVLQEHRQSRRVFPPDAEIVLIVFYSVLITTGKLWLIVWVTIVNIKFTEWRLYLF